MAASRSSRSLILRLALNFCRIYTRRTMRRQWGIYGGGSPVSIGLTLAHFLFRFFALCLREHVESPDRVILNSTQRCEFASSRGDIKTGAIPREAEAPQKGSSPPMSCASHPASNAAPAPGRHAAVCDRLPECVQRSPPVTPGRRHMRHIRLARIRTGQGRSGRAAEAPRIDQVASIDRRN